MILLSMIVSILHIESEFRDYELLSQDHTSRKPFNWGLNPELLGSKTSFPSLKSDCLKTTVSLILETEEGS